MSLIGNNGEYIDLFGENSNQALINVEDLTVLNSVILDYAEPNKNLITNSLKQVITEDKDSFIDVSNQITWTNTERAFTATLPQNIGVNSGVIFSAVNCNFFRPKDDIFDASDNYINFGSGQTDRNAWFRQTSDISTVLSGSIFSLNDNLHYFITADKDGLFKITYDTTSLPKYGGSSELLTLDNNDLTINTALNMPNLTPNKNIVINGSGVITTSDFASIIGTTNQIIVVESPTNTFTLSTPQNIDTNAEVRFKSVDLSDGSLSNPSLHFVGQTNTGFSLISGAPTGIYNGSEIFNWNTTRLNMLDHDITNVKDLYFTEPTGDNHIVLTSGQVDALTIGDAGDDLMRFRTSVGSERVEIIADMTLETLNPYDVLYIDANKQITGINVPEDFILVGGATSITVQNKSSFYELHQNVLGSKFDPLRLGQDCVILDSGISIEGLISTNKRRSLCINYFTSIPDTEQTRRFGFKIIRGIAGVGNNLSVGFGVSSLSLNDPLNADTGSYSYLGYNGTIYENGVNITVIETYTDNDYIEYEILNTGLYRIWKNNILVYSSIDTIVSGTYYPQVVDSATNSSSFLVGLRPTSDSIFSPLSNSYENNTLGDDFVFNILNVDLTTSDDGKTLTRATSSVRTAAYSNHIINSNDNIEIFFDNIVVSGSNMRIGITSSEYTGDNQNNATDYVFYNSVNSDIFGTFPGAPFNTPYNIVTGDYIKMVISEGYLYYYRFDGNKWVNITSSGLTPDAVPLNSNDYRISVTDGSTVSSSFSIRMLGSIKGNKTVKNFNWNNRIMGFINCTITTQTTMYVGGIRLYSDLPGSSNIKEDNDITNENYKLINTSPYVKKFMYDTNCSLLTTTTSSPLPNNTKLNFKIISDRDGTVLNNDITVRDGVNFNASIIVELGTNEGIEVQIQSSITPPVPAYTFIVSNLTARLIEL